MMDPNDVALHERLNILAEGLFVRDGKIWRIIDMQGHGSDIDEVVSEHENDPKYAQQVAAYRLQYLLWGKCKNGQPHRYRVVPEHEACVDCGMRKR